MLNAKRLLAERLSAILADHADDDVVTREHDCLPPCEAAGHPCAQQFDVQPARRRAIEFVSSGVVHIVREGELTTDCGIPEPVGLGETRRVRLRHVTCDGCNALVTSATKPDGSVDI